jgi:hypothetical protein
MPQEVIDLHRQVVDLVERHIAEIERLEKRRYASHGAESINRGGPWAPSAQIKYLDTDNLEDIDPEVTACIYT